MFSLGLLTAGAVAGCAPSRSFDADRMVWAERHIARAIDEGKIPGAVLLVGRGDEILYRRAFGHRAVEPEKAANEPHRVQSLL